MNKVNYVIATWSMGRYNPANDYLKVHLKRLFELKNNLAQITIVRPLGSDNNDYYNIEVPYNYHCKVVVINRSANDRSYGQFIYAYQQYTDQFTHYIIAEDDYVPNIDNFDTKLVELIEKKGCDYLCGKYAKQSAGDRLRAIQNQGIVKASSFKKMLELCAPEFPPMGPADGTEQLIFSEYFTNNGMTIQDYSDEYSVPYWAKTMTYFTKNKSWETLFVPYQCVSGTVHGHFLSSLSYTPTKKKYEKFISDTIMYYKESLVANKEDLCVIIEPQINLYPFAEDEIPLGVFHTFKEYGKLFIECFLHADYRTDELYVNVLERIAWENRGENLYVRINPSLSACQALKKLNWQKTLSDNIDNETDIEMYKDFRNW